MSSSRQAQNEYEDNIDFIGTVLMARVNKHRMSIELDDGREIEAAFPKEEEEKIIEALRGHAHSKVRVFGRGFLDAYGILQKITQVDRVQLLPKGVKEHKPVKAIWEEFDEIIATVPQEEIRSLPKDGAEHHDRYLYGASKDS